MTFTVKQPCDPKYRASKDSGERPLSDVRLIVLHSTEGGGSAKNVAKYFAGSSAEGSAHLVVDDGSCYRCMPNTVIPWAAAGANTDGFHIEQLGYAAWTKAQWMKHDEMLHRVAYKMAVHAKLFGIPLTLLTPKAIQEGKKGVVRHMDVSRWAGVYAPNVGDHSHTDPGTGYPIHYVIGLARVYLAAL